MPGEFRKREIIADQYIVTHTVDDSHHGVRLDQFVKNHYRGRSRNQLQKLIETGQIRMRLRDDQHVPKPSTRLVAGDEVIVISERKHEPAVNFNYKILYEDDDVLVVDKPPNLPVHPAGRFLFHTLLSQLRADRAQWIKTGERDFYLSHRIDRETSGVLALAKNPRAAAWLVKQFRERHTEKKYYAICHGPIEQKSFTVDLDIGPAQGSNVRLRVGVYPKGTDLEDPSLGTQSACTHFSVLKIFKKKGRSLTLLDCELETGRQHQIRAHLCAIGHPVFGDKLYSGDEKIFLHYLDHGFLTEEMKESLGFERHALHSRYLRFFHENTRKWIEIESPLPEDMQTLLS